MDYAQLQREYGGSDFNRTAQSVFQRIYDAQSGAKPVAYTGSKPLVVCGGVVTECKDLEEAQTVAEREAHAKSTDAYVLKPVRKVAPERKVVTTELT